MRFRSGTGQSDGLRNWLGNAGNAELSEAVDRWFAALSDYPVADDEHFSELEWEDNHPREGECYTGDPDCPCGNVEY